MKLTTGYDFQGYYITEYLDVIFDEMLVGLGLGKAVLSGLDNIFSALTGSEATEMVDRLNKAKQELRERVILKAKKLGANALIGIDFESSKLGDLIMVSMTATAVKIEKLVSPLPITQANLEKQVEEDRQAKLAEEKLRKMEKLKSSGMFSKETFIEGLSGLDTAREMVACIEQTEKEYPGLFGEDVIKQLDSYVQLERLYGKGAGTGKILSVVKEHLGV